MLAIVFLAGMLSGVALRSMTQIPNLFGTALFISSLLSLFYLSCISKRSPDKKILFAVISLLACALGILRFSQAEDSFNLSSMHTKSHEKIMFTGIISEIPIESEFSISAKAKTDYGYVLLRAVKGSELGYGNKVSGEATCEIPESFETDTGVVFDYKKYLMARDMHHICTLSQFEIKEKNAGSSIRKILYDIRLWFSAHIDSAFRDVHAGLVKGVLLGDKSGLSAELKSEMTVAGVIHIAVLSGSNIAMVAAIVFALSQAFPYNVRIVISVIVVLLFVLLSGAEPPAVRAGILVASLFLGKFLHRKLHTGRALLLIACIMVMWNPFALIYDMSFQLSFLATIGIVYVAPFLEQYLQRITEKCGIREVVAGTLGAQIAVTPLLLYATQAFSVVSLPANVLIGWAVPLLMIIGFIAGALHIISYFLAMPMVFIAEMLSGYIISITKISAQLPFAQIFVPMHHPLILCGVYVVLFFILKRGRSVLQKVSN